MPMILSTIENQYGEKIVDTQVYLENGKWYYETINCYSSSALGLGGCQCVSHDPISKYEISREEVISLIKENPLAAQELTIEELEDLEKYQKDKEYRLRKKFEEHFDMTPQELVEHFETLKEILNFSEKDLKDMIKKLPVFAQEYLYEKLNLEKNNKNKKNFLKR